MWSVLVLVASFSDVQPLSVFSARCFGSSVPSVVFWLSQHEVVT